MNILITGANGFLGNALVESLVHSKHSLIALMRKPLNEDSSSYQSLACTDLCSLFESESTEAYLAVNNVLNTTDVVIHTAARVHVMDDSASDPISEFRKVNTAATLNLAKQAAISGVKRFIFISSVKVNGEQTKPNEVFSPEDTHIPTDPYGLSKYEAEQGLLELARQTEMEVVIIRPPLVYGPGVRANFASMMKWLNKGIPFPLGAIHNKRSLIALDNLVSFITSCIEHPKAANQVFLISDGEDVSTTELLRKVANALGKKARLLPIPVCWMTSIAKLLGKQDVADRLFGSLQVDSSKARDLLGWQPVTTMDEQLKITAEAYLKNEKTL